MKLVKSIVVTATLLLISPEQSLAQFTGSEMVLDTDPAMEAAGSPSPLFGEVVGLDPDGNCTVDNGRVRAAPPDEVHGELLNMMDCAASQAEESSEKSSFFGVGTFEVKNIDESDPKEFFLLRRAAFVYADMKARASLSEKIAGLETSGGGQRASRGESAAYKEFESEEQLLGKQADELQRKASALLRKVDPLNARRLEKELDAKSGAGLLDRVYALMDAATKKMDPEFDANQLQENAQAQARNEAQAYKNEIQGLQREAEELQRREGGLRARQRELQDGLKVSEQGKAYTRMRQIGATPIFPQEFYDVRSKTLHVGVLMAWSENLAGGAVAAIEGVPARIATEDTETKAHRAPNVRAFIARSQFSDFAGSRKYVDPEGNHVYMGTAMLYNPGGLDGDEAKLTAKRLALLSLKAALYSDIQSEDMVKMSARFGRDSNSAVSSAERTLQNVLPDQVIQGYDEILRGAKHPETGLNVIVAIVWVDPSNVRDARQAFAASQASVENYNNVLGYWTGRRQGLIDKTEDAIKDKSSYSKGYNESYSPKKSGGSTRSPAGGSNSRGGGWNSFGGGTLDLDGL